MDFVAEEDGLAAEPAAVLRLAQDFPHPLDALGDGAERHELPLGVLRDHPREGRLAGARRTPEDHAAHVTPADRVAQRVPRCQQVRLAHDLVERTGAEPGGERRRRGEEGGFAHAGTPSQPTARAGRG